MRDSDVLETSFLLSYILGYARPFLLLCLHLHRRAASPAPDPASAGCQDLGSSHRWAPPSSLGELVAEAPVRGNRQRRFSRAARSPQLGAFGEN